MYAFVGTKIKNKYARYVQKNYCVFRIIMNMHVALREWVLIHFEFILFIKSVRRAYDTRSWNGDVYRNAAAWKGGV